MEQLTHWKAQANPDYIGSYALYQPDGKAYDKVVCIASVGPQTITGNGGRKSKELVAVLAAPDKPMILNATNKKTLEALFKTPFYERWKGNVQLYVDHEVKDKATGGKIDGLRIRPSLPVPVKDDLHPNHPRWNAAVEAVKNGNMAAVMQAHNVSPENQKLLQDASTKI